MAFCTNIAYATRMFLVKVTVKALKIC